jgi:hypothetical protein
MSDTPISDSTPHNVADLGMRIRMIERELNAANAIIRQQQLLDEEVLRLQDRIKLLEAVTNDPHALWANWLRGSVALPVGIGDVREYQDRIKRLEEALSLIRPTCEVVHHSKKHQHSLSQPCPVVELIKKAKEAKL